MDLVSVVVPVYNVERYLDECISSLLKQTYSNIELILVDDGSKDGSGKICDQYGREYPDIKVIHKENAGLGYARNSGLEIASGELVTFVDSDDYVEPTYIEELVNGLAVHHVDMCKGGFRKVQDDGSVKFQRSYHSEVFPGGEARARLLPRLIGSAPAQHDSVEMCVWGTIYKMSHIRQHHLRFPSEREMLSEDIVFNVAYMQYADGACLIPQAGYNYRENFSSLTKRYRAERFDLSRHLYLEMNQRLRELGYSSDTLHRLDRMFFIYLKACITQERRRVSGQTAARAIGNIKRICRDSTVQTVVAQYPVQYLGIKQRFFVELLRHKSAVVLWLLSEANII